MTIIDPLPGHNLMPLRDSFLSGQADGPAYKAEIYPAVKHQPCMHGT